MPEAGQEKAGWPVVTMVRFAEHVRAGNEDAEVAGVWLADNPIPWEGPTGYETERFIPEPTVSGLVETLTEIARDGFDLPLSYRGDPVGYYTDIARRASTSYKQEVERA